jgi:type II secretory pathway component GspD/PulD (secretin)
MTRAAALCLALGALGVGFVLAQEGSGEERETARPARRVLAERVAELERQVTELRGEVKRLGGRSDGEATDSARVFQVFRLKHTLAGTIAPILQQLLGTEGRGGPRVSSDERTNSLLIAAGPEQLEAIEALLRHLDRPAKDVAVEPQPSP